MRQCTIRNLRTGMVLGRPVFDDQFRLLLAQGTELNLEYIARLQRYKFNFVYIQEEGTESIVAEDLLDLEDRQHLFHVYQRAVGGKPSNARSAMIPERAAPEVQAPPPTRLRMLKQASSSLLDNLLQSPIQHFYPSVKVAEKLHFHHSLDVAMLCIMIGIRLHYPFRELEALALAALLHDIGKSKLPESLSEKPGDQRTLSEEKQYREHASLGAELVSNDPMLPLSVGVAIYQHHENFDGSGFPEGIRGDPNPPFSERNKRGSIFRHAEVIAVANYFDNLVNGKTRTDPLTPLQAVEEITALAGTRFHPYVVTEAISIINVFPIGSLVRIKQTRQTDLLLYRGVVSKVFSEDLHHPEVLLLRNDRGHKLDRPLLVNLKDDSQARLECILEL
ncbi:MAG: HD domain-containing protein [bacterium]|nr:HD domain-containing protein [bacterium]